jgi:hypothetical protein
LRSIVLGTCALILATGCKVVDGDAADGGPDADTTPTTDTGPTGGAQPTADAGPTGGAQPTADAGPTGGAQPTGDAGPTPTGDAGVPGAPSWAEVPPAAELALASGERHVLSGRESTDPTDGVPGPGGQMPADEVAAGDRVGDLAIAALWDASVMWYFVDGRYNDADFPVTEGTVSGVGDPALPAYTFEPPQTHATDFLGTQHALLYRFPEVADWRVYELADGVLKSVAEVPAASVVADDYTRLPGLFANTDHTRTLVFARADRSVSTYTPVGGDAWAARIGDSALGRVVQVQIPVPGAPRDTANDTRGPSAWENIYGLNRQTYPVTRAAGPGVVWQDGATHTPYVTWLSNDRPGVFETIALPNIAEGELAGAVADPDGSLTLLLVQGGDGREQGDTTRQIVALKAGADGTEELRKAHASDQNGLNVMRFEAAAMQRSGDRLGVVLTRTMTRSGDGLNHQASTQFLLDPNTLERVSDSVQTSSHSFGCVLQPRAPGGFLAMDLGDGYPRGLHLYTFDAAGQRSRVVFTFKTLHGDVATNPAGETYPVYAEASRDGQTFYQWSNDNRTYTELGGIAETPAGVVTLFATERSFLDNARVGAERNETRELAMLRVRSDFENAATGDSGEWVTDDLIGSVGAPGAAPAVEGEFYTFNGGRNAQRVTGTVFLTALDADQSASRPKLHAGPDGLLALYEVWRTTTENDTPVDRYVDTRGLRLGPDGLPLAGQDAALGRTVRLANRDDPFTLAGGTAVVEGQGAARRLVVTVILPPTGR